MTVKVDNLRGLFDICEGHVSVNINPHTTSYQKVKEYLVEQGRHNRGAIKAADQLDMVHRDKIVHIKFLPHYPGMEFNIYAGSVEMAAFRAFALAKQIMGKEDFTVDNGLVDLTDLLEDLGNTCKAEVHLDLNEYKSDKWGYSEHHGKVRTLDDWFAFEKELYPEDYEPDADGDVTVPETLVNQVIRDGNLLEVHFYPNTPVGFYSFFNSDYKNVLETALQIAKRETQAMDNLEVLAQTRLDDVFGTPAPKIDPNNFTIIDGLRKMY